MWNGFLLFVYGLFSCLYMDYSHVCLWITVIDTGKVCFDSAGAL